MNDTPRDLEVVRQTAELLSSGAPLSDSFTSFCMMLARFIDASVVFIAIARDGTAFLEYAYDHGIQWRDAHVRISPSSQTERALVSNETVQMRSEADVAGPVISLRFPGSRDENSASGVFVPLRYGAGTIGVLSVQSDRTDAYSADDVRLIETCAPYLAIAVHADLIRSEMKELETATALDAVTCVATRRIFDQRLHDDWSRARRDGTSIALALLDVDWFKRFNDTYGHVAGDVCLKQIAQAAGGCLTRDTDLFARYGGEEFIAILWATDAEGALIAAQRIRDAVYALDIPHADSPYGRVTVSVGVAAARASSTSAETLVRAADRALYAAKTSGRDRIVVDRFDEGAPITHAASANNLRTVSSSFLDRTNETAAVTQLLGQARLISVSGTSGVGKTRTAVAAAQRRLYAYPDGTWFIDVGALADAPLMEVATASLLNVSQVGRSTVRATLIDKIRRSTMLLMLDACDDLRPAVVEFAQAVVEGAPNATVVAIAQEPLNVQNEHIVRIEPLDDAHAAALFIERARTANHTFALQEQDRELIRSLCERVGMLPLAIELIAASVKTMKLPELVEAVPSHPADALTATIAWSFSLLDAPQQRLLENAAIFPCAFDSEALRGICADDVVESWDVAFVLNALIEKNLIGQLRDGPNERFELPQAVRRFAHGRLSARNGDADVERRFVRYYRSIARRIGEHLEAGASELGFALAGSEWDNVRAALSLAFRSGNPQVGYEIILALEDYWTGSRHVTEGMYWVEQALRMVPSDSEVRAPLLHAAALIARSEDDVARLTTLGEELVAIHEGGDSPQNYALALTVLAEARFRSGDAPGAAELHRIALDQYRLADDRRGIATTLMHLGVIAAAWDGDYAEARALLLGSLEIFRMLGAPQSIGIVLGYLGEVTAYRGDFERALAYAAESLAIFERIGDNVYAAWQVLDMARFRIALGEQHGVKRGLRLARKYLNGQPRIADIVTYLETALSFALAAEAYTLAGRIAGYLQSFVGAHSVPRSPRQREAFDSDVQRLRNLIGDGELETLAQRGAGEDLAALQNEIEALGD